MIGHGATSLPELMELSGHRSGRTHDDSVFPCLTLYRANHLHIGRQGIAVAGGSSEIVCCGKPFLFQCGIDGLALIAADCLRERFKADPCIGNQWKRTMLGAIIGLDIEREELVAGVLEQRP